MMRKKKKATVPIFLSIVFFLLGGLIFIEIIKLQTNFEYITKETLAIASWIISVCLFIIGFLRIRKAKRITNSVLYKVNEFTSTEFYNYCKSLGKEEHLFFVRSGYKTIDFVVYYEEVSFNAIVYEEKIKFYISPKSQYESKIGYKMVKKIKNAEQIHDPINMSEEELFKLFIKFIERRIKQFNFK